LANSIVQLVSVERGTMTRKGPGWRFFSIMYVIREIVWMVFPKPYSVSAMYFLGNKQLTISSARIPLSLLL
jgi:hypothetical protein